MDHSAHSGQTDHAQHAAGTEHAAHEPAGHDAMQHTPTPAAIPATPVPIALAPDPFDAPAASAVAEAAKTAGGGGHEGHGSTRGITPGEDRENPPTPMPARRDGSTPGAPTEDHSHHGKP